MECLLVTISATSGQGGMKDFEIVQNRIEASCLLSVRVPTFWLVVQKCCHDRGWGLLEHNPELCKFIERCTQSKIVKKNLPA